MRYLAVDLGDRRTGIASGDSITCLVGPVGVLEVPMARDGGEALLVRIVAVVNEQLGEGAAARGQVVVGLPLNMDGSEGPRAKLIRAFAKRIAERTGREVHLHDERLTSAEADWAMARSGLTRKQKKGRRDALAAAAILRDFLAGLKGQATPAGPEPNDGT